MGYEPRLITFFKNGLIKNFKPWLISNEAFPTLFNSYAWRGVVKKREGYELLASLPGGDAPVQGLKVWVNPATLTQTTVAFSLTKSYYFDVVSSTFIDITFLQDSSPFSWLNTTSNYFWSSNYASSMWVSNNVTGDRIRFWTGALANGWCDFLPTVNGTTQLEKTLMILPYKGRLVCLNTTEGGLGFQSRARWSQIGTPYTSNTTATNITAIATANPTVLTVVSTAGFVIGKPAGIINVTGSVASALNFNQFNVSAIGAGTITIDVDTTGLAYTGGGTAQGPGTTAPPPPFGISIFGWRDDIPGNGGYVDADTSERIVSAEIVKDVLIVAFQRSTWRLRYTGNEILPFIWERLNTQYGAESTFSNIPFDEDALFFSRYGWIGATPNDVARIDQQIPDDSFSVESTNTGLEGLSRIQGIRDYYRQFAYWCFPAIEQPDVDVADQIYAYNYIDKSWSIFKPSVPIRVFGTLSQNYDTTWQVLNEPDDTWQNFNSPQSTWANIGSSQNIEFPLILGGDANGNVYTMFEFGNTRTSDDGMNFGFEILTKRFNPYIEKGLNCRIGYVDVYCTTINGGTVTFNHYVNDQGNPVFSRKLETYPRNALNIASITPLLQTQVTTTVPHGLTSGQQVTITNVIGTMAEVINNQNLPVIVLGPNLFSIDLDTTGTQYSSGGTVTVSLRSNYGSATYTRMYLGAIGHMHQFGFTLTNDQIEDPISGTAQFELQGIVMWSRPVGMIRG